NGEKVAYPTEPLKQARVVNDKVGGAQVAVFCDGGPCQVFSRRLDGRVLTFAADRSRAAGAVAVDEETGSLWDLRGRSVAGPLRGRALEPIAHASSVFWFAWSAFHPAARVRRPEPAPDSAPETGQKTPGSPLRLAS
ncbi:MAG: DUF3179 domain-containing (seleno)protein, partial [Alphaproteobacteria bacterium]